jgi:signal transduction histidine kinase
MKQHLMDLGDEDDKDTLHSILETLINSRLVVTDAANSWIELTHEGLIEKWDLLNQWRSENRDTRRLVDKIEDGFCEWIKFDEIDGFLLGSGLDEQCRSQWQDLKEYLSYSAQRFCELSERYWVNIRASVDSLSQMNKVQEHQRAPNDIKHREADRQSVANVIAEQQHLHTLQRMTDLLNQRLTNLPGLLQVLIDGVCDTIVEAEFGLIVLHSHKTQRLELTATVGMPRDSEMLAEAFSPEEGVLGEVFHTGEPQLIRPSAIERQMNGNERLPAALCAVAIESLQGGRLGVLTVGNWQNAAAFNDDDLQLLIAFAEQAAIALNNAQLINTLEEREERLAFQNNILAQQNHELETQRQQIQSQNLRLLEATERKSQVLATTSHELRTPMHAVMGFSQLLLRQNQLSPQQTDMITRILTNGKIVVNLIDDILDLSRIEAGHLELKPKRFRLPDLLATTTAELQSLAAQKQLQLSHQSALADPYVINDSDRLRQVIVNLLSNAIKYTESGRIDVEVREVSADHIVILVSDTGIGIAPGEIPNIFEEFYQVDETRRHAGTGLGLAITRWLVQTMGGQISVNSQLGKGSTFQVNLPRVIGTLMP